MTILDECASPKRFAELVFPADADRLDGENVSRVPVGDRKAAEVVHALLWPVIQAARTHDDHAITCEVGELYTKLERARKASE